MRRIEAAIWAVALGAGLAVAGLSFLRLTSAGAEGPLEPAWDRQACAQCGMLLSDPRFACQMRERSGGTLFFDDPGCLLSYLKAHPRSGSRGIWLHRFIGAGWLPLRSAAFVEAPDSPMGYRLACVERGGPEAHTLAWAEARVASEIRGREGGPDLSRSGGGR